MKRLFALFVVSIVASGCGGGPLAPTPVSHSPSPSSGAGTFAVSGAVADLDTGRSIVGARVQVEAGRQNRSVYTGPEGFYAVKGLPSGLLTVTVSKIGYESQSTNADVTDDMSLSFELRHGG